MSHQHLPYRLHEQTQNLQQPQQQFREAGDEEDSYQVYGSISHPYCQSFPLSGGYGGLHRFDGYEQPPPDVKFDPGHSSSACAHSLIPHNPPPLQAPLVVDGLSCLPVGPQQFAAFPPHSPSHHHPPQLPLNAPGFPPQQTFVPPVQHPHPDLLASPDDFLPARSSPGLTHPTDLPSPAQVSPETHRRLPKPVSAFVDHPVLPLSTALAPEPPLRYMAADVAVANDLLHDDKLHAADSELTMSRAKPNSPTDLPDNASVSYKRSRSDNTSADEKDKKRSRGRPRLDTRDETAADRRRTQIRLAQRAYRNRKENAIQTLEKKVADLKETNEEMSNAFMKLHDFAVSQGLLDRVPEFGKHLRATTAQFLNLARRSSEDGKEDDPTKSPGTETVLSTETNQTPKGSDTSDGAAKATPTITAANLSAPLANGGTAPATSTVSDDYEVVTHPTLENASFPFGTSSDPFNAFIAPSPYSSGLLQPPTSLAHHENTFGRRLQRTTIEQALLLVNMPAADPEAYGRIFGFCLLFEPRERIRQRLTDALSATTHETMHNWRYPFLNLCGQGSFLPGWQQHDQRLGLNRGPVGNEGTAEPLRPQHSTGYPTGPFTSAVAHIKETRLGLGQRITLPGYEGDFFDADEIEMYLRQRGVHIPPNSEFVTAEIDINSFPTDESIAPDWADTDRLGSLMSTDPLNQGMGSLNASIGLTGGQSPATTPPNGLATPASSTDASINRVSSSASTLPTTTVGDAAWNNLSISKLLAPEAAMHDYTALPPSSHSATPPTTTAYYFGNLNTNFLDSGLLAGFGSQKNPLPSRRVITLNVTAFINELINRAVCLGRSPGYKPQDVNAAFWMAIQNLDGRWHAQV